MFDVNEWECTTFLLQLQSSPFDVFILHENAQEVDIVCDSHGRHYPKDRMSVKAWERFCLFFISTLKDKETRLFRSHLFGVQEAFFNLAAKIALYNFYQAFSRFFA